jgi:hypothetical protein
MTKRRSGCNEVAGEQDVVKLDSERPCEGSDLRCPVGTGLVRPAYRAGRGPTRGTKPGQPACPGLNKAIYHRPIRRAAPVRAAL